MEWYSSIASFILDFEFLVIILIEILSPLQKKIVHAVKNLYFLHCLNKD